ncbi:MAG TPA: NUDIX hydrolase [Isosphaeraceae bacterium]|nr:NUDIX hydrolase [Isosphaeraceae bacterium]
MTDLAGQRRLIYKGRKLDLALERVRLADRSEADREVILHRGAVALVPMVDADHVCLVRNDRYAVGKTLLEVPAGTVDPGETVEQTAARELEEETGYTAGKLTKVAEWFVSPGWLTERMSLFLCEELTQGPTAHQPDERLVPVVVAWEEAVRMVADGHIEDGKSIAAILLCDRLRTG